jgi:hypothetical protein
MVTLTTGIMFLLLICITFGSGGTLRSLSTCAPTACEVAAIAEILRNTGPAVPLRPWRWRRRVPLTRWCPSVSLYGATTQGNNIVKTSNNIESAKWWLDWNDFGKVLTADFVNKLMNFGFYKGRPMFWSGYVSPGWSRGSSVSIVSGRPGDPRSIPGRGKEFFL